MDDPVAWLATGGALAVLVSVIAWMADRARMRRQQLDRVGLVPWTGVFFWSTMLAVLLLGGAAKAWF